MYFFEYNSLERSLNLFIYCKNSIKYRKDSKLYRRFIAIFHSLLRKIYKSLFNTEKNRSVSV